jgi:hypothetical protein
MEKPLESGMTPAVSDEEFLASIDELNEIFR